MTPPLANHVYSFILRSFYPKATESEVAQASSIATFVQSVLQQTPPPPPDLLERVLSVRDPASTEPKPRIKIELVFCIRPTYVVFLSQIEADGTYKIKRTGFLIGENGEKREVAFLCIQKRRNRDATELQRFKDLSGNPWIPGLIDSFTLSDGTPVMIQTHCQGGDLGTLIERLTSQENGLLLPRDEIACLFYQVLYILKQLQDKALVHRDIKPANLLLDAPYIPRAPLHLRICDFGTSCRTDDLSPFTACTPSFCAPEIAKLLLARIPLPPASSKQDLFSLGCIIARLLAEKSLQYALSLPQASESDNAMNEALNTRAYFYLPRLEETGPLQRLTKLAFLCLTPDPDQRPTVGEMLRSPLLIAELVASPSLRVTLASGALQVSDLFTSLFDTDLLQEHHNRVQKAFQQETFFVPVPSSLPRQGE